MNKWRQRAREWRERNESLWDFWQQTSDRLVEALNKVEELRCELVKSATELARVQGECEATQARLVSLQESDMLDLLEKKRLLAWQVRARDAWAHYKKAHLSEKWTVPLDDLRQAIEAGAEPKGET